MYTLKKTVHPTNRLIELYIDNFLVAKYLIFVRNVYLWDHNLYYESSKNKTVIILLFRFIIMFGTEGGS